MTITSRDENASVVLCKGLSTTLVNAMISEVIETREPSCQIDPLHHLRRTFMVKILYDVVVGDVFFQRAHFS